MKAFSIRAASFGLVGCLFFGTSLAGVILQFETKKSGGGDGSPGSILVDADRLRLEQGGTAAIFRGDKQLLWVIDQKAGKYVELSKEQMQRIGAQVSAAMSQMQEQLKSLPPEQRAKIEEMMKMNAPHAETKPAAPLKFVQNGKSETINGYPCIGYDGMRGDEQEMEIWVTDWKLFGLTAADFKVLEQMGAFMKDAIGPLAKKFSCVFAQPYSDAERPDALPGVPIRIISHGDGGGSVMEIKKVSKEELPGQRFEVPEGLKKEEIGSGLKVKSRRLGRIAPAPTRDTARPDDAAARPSVASETGRTFRTPPSLRTASLPRVMDSLGPLSFEVSGISDSDLTFGIGLVGTGEPM